LTELVPLYAGFRIPYSSLHV